MITQNNLDLTNYNSYRLHSTCAKAYFPQSEYELVQCFRNNPDIPKIIIGNGNNIILSKAYYSAEFIILNSCYEALKVSGTEIMAEAGATMLQMSEAALKHSLAGLEIFYDIPSSVGGAVVMNAGAGGEEIKDLLVSVRYLDLDDLKIKEITRDEIGYEYRNSLFQKNPGKIVLKAWFRLSQGNPLVIKTKMTENKQKRWAKQPREYPNCGSVFKRPPNGFVGPMLDELDLKGFTIGGAKISEKHSGFIVNTGKATGEEIIAVIRTAQKKVKEKFGIELEVEQKII